MISTDWIVAIACLLAGIAWLAFINYIIGAIIVRRGKDS